MRIIEFSREHAQPIELFNSVAASSVPLADGEGETHVYCLHFEPGGEIGVHPTGLPQLFLVIDGEGWASAGDGERVRLCAGQGAVFERGEQHAKGSEPGMTALMAQIEKLRADDAD